MSIIRTSSSSSINITSCDSSITGTSIRNGSSIIRLVDVVVVKIEFEI